MSSNKNEYILNSNDKYNCSVHGTNHEKILKLKIGNFVPSSIKDRQIKSELNICYDEINKIKFLQKFSGFKN